MVLLIAPAIQKETSLVQIPELSGDFVLAEKPEITIEGWFSGDYQSNFNNYLEDHIGFRNILVRISNQLDFSLYKEVHADGVVVGKNHQLYEYDYIRGYIGGDFLGEDDIDKRVRKLKFVQKYLKDSLNIDFTLVFEPGKASFYHEYILDEYYKNALPKTNYEYFRDVSTSYGVTFIDFNQWFKDLKPTAPYPLYAPYGTHWTTYGASLAADSLLNFMEQTRHIKMRNVSIDSLEIQDHTRTSDRDMGLALNLLFPMPENGPFAYPVFQYEENPQNITRPMVLVIADSYYWNIFNTNIVYEVFKKPAFWYFGNLVYPETYDNPIFAVNLNLKEEIEKQDFLFLMVTERFLHKFDWGLVDNLYKIYGIRSKYDKVYDYKGEIWIYTEWFNQVVEKAKQRNITVAEMLDLEAKYVYMTREVENYLICMGPAHYARLMRSDCNWLSQIQKKADEKQIGLDEMINIEAEYMLKTEHPDAFKTWMQIEQNKIQIKNDSLHFAKVKQAASYYYKTVDEMLQIEAEKMLD